MDRNSHKLYNILSYFISIILVNSILKGYQYCGPTNWVFLIIKILALISRKAILRFTDYLGDQWFVWKKGEPGSNLSVSYLAVVGCSTCQPFILEVNYLE